MPRNHSDRGSSHAPRRLGAVVALTFAPCALASCATGELPQGTAESLDASITNEVPARIEVPDAFDASTDGFSSRVATPDREAVDAQVVDVQVVDAHVVDAHVVDAHVVDPALDAGCDDSTRDAEPRSERENHDGGIGADRGKPDRDHD